MTGEAPLLTNDAGQSFIINNGQPYPVTSGKFVGHYTAAAAWAKGNADKTKWADSTSGAKTYNVVVSAKTQESGKVGMVLLAQNATSAATPSSAVTHTIVATIGADGTLGVSTINGNAAATGGEYAVRPASESTTTPESSMPADDYDDSTYLTGSFMQIDSCMVAP